MITPPILRLVAALGFGAYVALSAPGLVHAQAAPAGQTAGFAIADQIRAGRSVATGHALQAEQERQFGLAQEAALAQAMAEMAQAEAAAQPGFRIGASADGQVLVEGSPVLLGAGLVPGAGTGGDITLQINIQAGTGNTAVNATAGN